MKILVPIGTYEEITDFPYTMNKWGCDADNYELMDSIFYTVENPYLDADGMETIMDIDGMKEWYEKEVSEEEKIDYECPTVYDYISCEIGRCCTPMRFHKEQK